MQTLRVSTAKFKYNMSPFVSAAKSGRKVIVTNDGTDNFEVVPCHPCNVPPGISVPMPASAFVGINLDEPAFKSWEAK